MGHWREPDLQERRDDCGEPQIRRQMTCRAAPLCHTVNPNTTLHRINICKSEKNEESRNEESRNEESRNEESRNEESRNEESRNEELTGLVSHLGLHWSSFFSSNTDSYTKALSICRYQRPIPAFIFPFLVEGPSPACLHGDVIALPGMFRGMTLNASIQRLFIPGVSVAQKYNNSLCEKARLSIDLMDGFNLYHGTFQKKPPKYVNSRTSFLLH